MFSKRLKIFVIIITLPLLIYIARLVQMQVVSRKYYQERIDAAENASLKQLLKHNMNEEKEHVAMLVEWLRKNDAIQDTMFKVQNYITEQGVRVE